MSLQIQIQATVNRILLHPIQVPLIDRGTRDACVALSGNMMLFILDLLYCGTPALLQMLSSYGLSAAAGTGPLRSLSFSLLNSSRHKASSVSQLHVLTVSATVTRLKWRPPANDPLPIQGGGPEIDRHDSMLAVATAPIKGATDGGSGVLALWTYHRPFMPLSVVEGHQAGAVTDFFWLDTPSPENSLLPETKLSHKNVDEIDAGVVRPRIRGLVSQGSETVSSKVRGDDKDVKDGLSVWQHILSVGRDGQCLVQSFARGMLVV